MATLAVTNPTLMDLAKRTAPDGSIDTLVELLNQTGDDILTNMGWQEGNLPTGHRTTMRTGLPTPTWRKINQGVQPGKSTTAQVTFNTGMLEAYAEVDKALADLNGNTAEWRLSEEQGHIEGMKQEMVQTLFYGNEGSEPEAFTGLSPMYNLKSAPSGQNIIDAGGTGTDNSSIWLIVWGPNTIHGIIPKGSTAGLQMRDMGEVTIENADGQGGRMQGYRSHYRWDAGLAVRDWRYAVRIANIDKSLLTADISTGADLPDLMFQALETVQSLGSGRAEFYMPRGTISMLRRQTAKKVQNSTLSIDNVGGVMVTSFNGVPLKRVDALAGDEARVV